MTRSFKIKRGEIFKDKSGLAVKVERIDPNQRIRFSIVGDQDTNAGPGEMCYESFVTRFPANNKMSKHELNRRKVA